MGGWEGAHYLDSGCNGDELNAIGDKWDEYGAKKENVVSSFQICSLTIGWMLLFAFIKC